METLHLSEKETTRLLETLQTIKALDGKKTRRLQIANKAREAILIIHKARKRKTKPLS